MYPCSQQVWGEQCVLIKSHILKSTHSLRADCADARKSVHPPAHPLQTLRSNHVRTRRLRARGMDPAAPDAGGKTASNPWGGQNVRAQAPRQSSIFDAHRSIRMAHRSFIHPALHSHVSPACIVAESKSLIFNHSSPSRVFRAFGSLGLTICFVMLLLLFFPWVMHTKILLVCIMGGAVWLARAGGTSGEKAREARC